MQQIKTQSDTLIRVHTRLQNQTIKQSSPTSDKTRLLYLLSSRKEKTETRSNMITSNQPLTTHQQNFTLLLVVV